MKTKDIKIRLNDHVDVVSSRNGIYTAKRSYFFGMTKDGSNLADKVKALIPEAFIIDYGNHWHAFVGGARPGSSKDSYWWVKFKA